MTAEMREKILGNKLEAIPHTAGPFQKWQLSNLAGSPAVSTESIPPSAPSLLQFVHSHRLLFPPPSTSSLPLNAFFTDSSEAIVKLPDKPSFCTADELHFVSVSNFDWRLALWRYRPSPMATPRNHPLLLLSGVGTNAIGYDLCTTEADPAQALNVPVVPLGAMLAAAYPLTYRPPYVLSWLNSLISAEDMMEPELLKKLILSNFCTVPAKLILQLTTAFRDRGLCNRDGTFFYKDHIHKSNVPVLAIAGDQDLICPPEAVEGSEAGVSLYKRIPK